MASSPSPTKCVARTECKKNGITQCDGCSARFCSEHFITHRQELETHFELLCCNRNMFYHEVTQTLQSEIELLLSQIDHWEAKSLTQVKKVANDARDQIRHLPETKRRNQQLEQFSEELRRRKETEDYFEQDIKRLEEQLEKIKMESKILSTINIIYTPIDWEKTVQVKDKDEKQQHQDIFHDTRLLSLEQQQILNEFYGNPHQQWQLIYRGTRDGFEENKFFDYCADQGPTMTLILAENKSVFGGYTSVSWKNSKEEIWDNDPSAFLFTLTNPHGLQPTKYPIASSGHRAIRSWSIFGPTFGEYDICIHVNSNKNTWSNIGFPENYSDTTNQRKQTFTGSKDFRTTNIEVYKLFQPE